MAKPETFSLRKHLAELPAMKGAHIAFAEAVEGFPTALRGIKPPGAPHTAWQLLEHLRLAQADILEFSRNAEYKSKGFPDDYWPPAEVPPTEDAWNNSVRNFQEDLKAIQAFVADTKHDLLVKLPHGTGQTLLREALLVADHNSYHLGQFVLLRKILEAGDPN